MATLLRSFNPLAPTTFRTKTLNQGFTRHPTRLFSHPRSIAMSSDLPFKLSDPSIFHDKSYVNGEWIESQSGQRFDVIDPGTGRKWATCPSTTASDVPNAVTSAHTAFQTFRTLNPRVRAQQLLAWDSLIRSHKEDLAQLITHETGKPLFESRAEIDYAAGFTWWFAGEAERIRGTVAMPATPGRRVFTIKQPIGVAAMLVPWNFPVAMILRKCGAAFAAGCTVVVKPSPESPLSVLALAHLAEKAGFAKGVMNVLTTDLENTPAVSEALCKHELVKKVSFTGSVNIGKLVARHCADGLKKVSLELGGNCPVIVFDDADLDKAIEAISALKFRHAGQACITANRIFVQAGVYDKFVSLLLDKAKALKLGHGAHPDTTMGPVTTARGLDKADEHVADAKSRGAKVLHGGQRREGEGYFFHPTVIGEATDEMRLVKEEQFAPIAAVLKFETEEEVVRRANDTSVGLASYFFTKDVDRTWRLLENLEAGMIGMNTGNQSAAETPFGGIKQSGYGKESGKDVAVEEYLITKAGTLTLDDHY